GVANSTVFGGIAGETIAAWLEASSPFPQPDVAAINTAIAASERPFAHESGDIEAIRESLYVGMWKHVGILRTAAGLTRALALLADLDHALDHTGIAHHDRAFNISWHDWLNLKSLVAVSRVIARAALARDESRGAHFREDFPISGAL